MLLFWPIIIPFFTAVLAIFAYKSTEMQRGISLIGAIALLAASVWVLSEVARNGVVASQAGGWPAPFGITLVADWLSAIMITLVGVVAVAAIVYAVADVRGREEHYGFHPLMHAMLAGICGAFLTGDLFNMYVWFEVMLISSFGLLVIGGDKAQMDGATKYVGLNLIATVAFLSGVGLLYGATGALNMADLHYKVAGREGETAIIASAAFLVFAFGSKAALFPAFFWLPASYHTPAFTTSAVFAALLTKVGIYALLRVFTLIYDIDGTPIQDVLLWAAVLTMIVGALGALSQFTIRRVLNFSIISSVGYVILGLALNTGMAIVAALFYLFQDVIVKICLFFGAGAAARMTGSERFDESGGLWRSRPWFSALFLLSALSLAGVPPFAGFWAKLLVVRATLDAGSLTLTFVALAVGFLTLFAVARIWAAVFWSGHPDGDYAITERPPAAMLVPLTVMTALIVWIGIDAGRFIDIAMTAANQVLDPEAYLSTVLGDAK